MIDLAWALSNDRKHFGWIQISHAMEQATELVEFLSDMTELLVLNCNSKFIYGRKTIPPTFTFLGQQSEAYLHKDTST